MIQLFKIMHQYDTVSLKNITLLYNVLCGHEYKQKKIVLSRSDQDRLSN